ncbi:MAG: asparagine synthase (glutamine-hydrolyzing) [Gammaproteobacteria bacterium]|nr:asparagine synthase (glutamine-hydrolyzing) [Gammaproteobacteria bacterium]
MCGIFGIASTNGNNISCKDYTDTLFHRGPDDSGFYNDNYVCLGHRRLSIIDLGGGHQPLLNDNETIIIVFNGEIYNFHELRDLLISRGYEFKTKSDTEAILHAYEEWGASCVDYLRGMFAFAIWDKMNETLFIARDRLGIKPLFYAEHNGVLYFSSEIKAIIEDNNFPREIDEQALVSYFTFSYIPAPMTIYKHIRKLLPGHTLQWSNGKVEIKKYWDIHFIPDRTKNEKAFIEEFMDIFSDSVQGHLISDVPIGAFLSGGVDSSAIVAFMSQLSSSPVNTFCMGFGGNTGGYLDERIYADIMAKKYHTNHHNFEVTPELDGILDKIVRAFDEPFADDSSIPSYFVCKIASENLKVALSGLGGDELFAGYERYLGFKLQSLYSRLPLFLRKNVISALVEKIPEQMDIILSII